MFTEVQKVTQKYVNTNIGLIPLEDYLDIQAQRCGYDDYADLRANGLRINVNEGSITELEVRM